MENNESKKQSRWQVPNGALWLGTLMAGFGIGACVTPGVVQRGVGATANAPGLIAPAAADTAYVASSEPIVNAVRKAAPAIVSIDTTARVGYRVFRDPMDEMLGRGRNVVREVPTGAGSGVLLEGGYVLTNQHVVGDAVRTGGKIQVTLADGRKVTASPVGADYATDIALLKAETTEKLPVAPLGADDQLLPGQTVIAIGNPVGLNFSVSSGVVSALGRPLTIEGRTYEDLIQTDTAINPGNSGGALVDLGGRVVGINTLVRTDAQNIGFAIPLKTALQIAEQLKQYGRIRRAATGVIPMDIDARVRNVLDLPEATTGVFVRGIYRGSPAESAEIRPGDIIRQIEGTPIPNTAAYRKTLAALKPGQTVSLVIVRDGQEGKVTLRLTEAPQ
jgi:S1-C subfamily serine protease